MRFVKYCINKLSNWLFSFLIYFFTLLFAQLIKYSFSVCLFVSDDETMCSLIKKQNAHFENVYHIWKITKRSIWFRWIFLVHAVFFIVRSIFECKVRFFDIQTINKTFFINFLWFDNISIFALLDQLESSFKSWKKWINIFSMSLDMYFRVFLVIGFKNWIWIF